MNKNLEMIIRNYCKKHNIRIVHKRNDSDGEAYINVDKNEYCIMNRDNIVINICVSKSHEYYSFILVHELIHTTGILLNRRSVIRYETSCYCRIEECLVNEVTDRIMNMFSEPIFEDGEICRFEECERTDKIEFDFQQAFKFFLN